MTIPADLIAALRSARRVTVLTGAGVSAESGVPTFREAQTGLWARFRPEDLATPRAFQANPQLVWDWYAWRRELVAGAQPNPAHLALVELARRVPACALITQNVDGLHQRAGSRAVIELHGNLARIKCSAENRVVPEWAAGSGGPPRCPHCGAWLRPDVVWFEESLPEAALAEAQARSTGCDVFLCVGTSAVVHPAAELPRLARAHGATLVEINPQPTPLSPHAHFCLSGAAGVVLPALVAYLPP